jgi:hypothetical protein
MTPEDYAQAWNRALPIETYLSNQLSAEVDETHPYAAYYRINQQRVRRLSQRLRLEAETEAAGLNAKPGTKWLILSETWCGDAAQSLPVLAALERASNGRIEARVLYRDENLDLMDQFLTNGGRSIPKVIQLDGSFAVTSDWGPRPAEAQELVQRIKSDPERAHTYSEELHKWYATDRQQAIQREVRELISRA